MRRHVGGKSPNNYLPYYVKPHCIFILPVKQENSYLQLLILKYFLINKNTARLTHSGHFQRMLIFGLSHLVLYSLQRGCITSSSNCWGACMCHLRGWPLVMGSCPWRDQLGQILNNNKYIYTTLALDCCFDFI